MEEKHIAKPKKSVLINHEIHFPRVRLIDEAGEMQGVVPIEQALRMAQQSELDLVLLSPNQDNPVCRIMDYGKYAFEQSKREREAKRNQKTTEVKEVQLKLTTDEHDFVVKARGAIRFLQNEDRVKVVIRFRGREMAYQSQGIEVMNKFSAYCEEVGTVDRPPRIEGRNMIMYLSPKPLKEGQSRQTAKSKDEAAESVE